MTMRSLIVALLIAAAPVSAQTTRRTDQIAVSYRSATSVYVSGGRAAGLAVGDRLNVMSGSTVVAELEVAFLAEHSASCRILKETGTVKTGDRVVRVGAPRAAAPAPSPSPSPRPWGDPSPAPAEPVFRGDRRRPGNGCGRLARGLPVGDPGSYAGAESDRGGTGYRARCDLGARGLAGRPRGRRVR